MESISSFTLPYVPSFMVARLCPSKLWRWETVSVCVCEQIQASKRNKENRSTWCSRRNQQGNSAENHVKWNWITENFWLAGICVSKGSYTCCVCVRVRWAKKKNKKRNLIVSSLPPSTPETFVGWFSLGLPAFRIGNSRWLASGNTDELAVPFFAFHFHSLRRLLVFSFSGGEWSQSAAASSGIHV